MAFTLLVLLPFAVAAAETEAPGDPVALVVDDGGMDGTDGTATPILVFNRFSPREFPLQITRLAVLWPPNDIGIDVGDPFSLFLYEDADGDVLNGTQYRASVQGVVTAVNGVDFSVVEIEPVVFEGPGDILIATLPPEFGSFWAAVDTTTPQLRSWVSFWDGTLPPPIPGPGTGLVTSLNWMIRGEGEVLVPVGLQAVTVD